LLLVVRLRGTIDVRRDAAEAMRRLGLNTKFSATLVNDDSSTMGMLRVAATSIAWYRIEKELLVRLIQERIRMKGGKRPTSDDFKKAGFEDANDMATKLLSGQVKWGDLKGFVHVFNLAPPKGGYPRPANRFYGAGGLLAENPQLSSLVERMI